MAVLAGKGGTVRIGAVVVAEMDDWTYSPSAAMLESTAFLANSKTFAGGLNDNAGAFKGRHDQTDATGQATLHTAMLAGTVVALRLYTEATHYYSGNALIKGQAIAAPVAGLVTRQFDFQGTGDFVYV